MTKQLYFKDLMSVMKERTNNINFKLNKSNAVVDVNIFVSDWLKNVLIILTQARKSYVVKGGPNKDIFNNKNKHIGIKHQN